VQMPEGFCKSFHTFCYVAHALGTVSDNATKLGCLKRNNMHRRDAIIPSW
jgi:hypothetical protein